MHLSAGRTDKTKMKRRRRKINEKSMKMSIKWVDEINVEKEIEEKKTNIYLYLPALRCFSPFCMLALSLSLCRVFVYRLPISFLFANFCNIQYIVNYCRQVLYVAMAHPLVCIHICIRHLTRSIIKNMMLSSHHNCYSLFWLFVCSFFIHWSLLHSHLNVFALLVLLFFLLLNTIWFYLKYVGNISEHL